MVKPRRPIDDFAEDEGETPPWLETRPRRTALPPPAEPQTTFVSWRALIIGGLIVLAVAIGLVVAVRSLMENRGGDGQGTTESAAVDGLIRAPEDPYKVRPTDAGGIEIEGIDQTIHDTGAGSPPEGILAEAPPEEPAGSAAPPPRDLMPALDDSAPAPEPIMPEAAGAGRSAAAQTAPQTEASKPAPAASTGELPPPPPKPAPAPVAQKTVQLGAFSSADKADAAWSRVSAKVGAAGGGAKSVTPVTRDGATLYRLRATVPAARAEPLCAELAAAGESCMVL